MGSFASPEKLEDSMAMRRKLAAKKATKKKATKKKAAKKKARVVKRAVMKTSRKAPARKAKKAVDPTAMVASMNGWVTHTEFASADPDATRAWCERGLGWKFGPSVPSPTGDYHMFMFGPGIGGGIRRNNPPEVPGTVPYVQVKDASAAFKRALDAGAVAMMEPTPIMPGVTIAIVRAPGDVVVGLAGP